MSKKIFLKKSYADAVKGHEPEEEGQPGESVLRPKYFGFKYTDKTSPDKKETISQHPASKCLPHTPKKSPIRRKATTNIDEDLEKIIEILSSPEKTPNKTAEDAIVLSSESDSPTNVKRELFSDSDDSDSLPSLDGSVNSANVSFEDQSFAAFKGKNFAGVYDAFTTVNRGLTVNEIMEVMHHSERYQKCYSIPQYVQEPGSFLIPTSILKNKKDLRADGNGVWNNRNKPKRFYSLKGSGIYGLFNPQKDDTREKIEVTRSYANHNNTSTFRRLIIEVKGCPYVILQYYFIGNALPVIIEPHGNSKRKDACSYRRVANSTIERMKEIGSEKGKSAKSVLKDIMIESGGMECPTNAIPRGEQQVKNLKRKALSKESTDEIKELLYSYDNQTDSFIRKVEIRPDFIVVLASDNQLKDLSRFCAEDSHSILGIDPTFNFGDFDVTITTYKHPMLENITSGRDLQNKSPVFVGPICIHKRKQTQTYFNFFETLISAENTLKNIKVVGTDGEIALMNAVVMAFENAINLRCFNHVQRNILNKLQDMGVSKLERNIILADIFGKVTDKFNKISGIVDSITTSEFDERLNSLKQKWNDIIPSFWDWFQRHQCDIFKTSMIQSVRLRAGLQPNLPYTTNDNESMNSAMQRVCGKHQSVMRFINEAKEFIESQEKQLLFAVLQQGSYKLRDEFTKLCIPLSEWSEKSGIERQRHMNKVMKYKIGTCNASHKDQNMCMVSSEVRINEQLADIKDIPLTILEDMLSKAKTIISTKNAINEIPNLECSRRVISLSNARDSHLCDFNRKTGRIACDCRSYKLNRICHHSISVAEDIEMLETFLTWRKHAPTSCSISKGVHQNLPQRAGKKPNERHNWPKKPKLMDPSNVTVVDPIDINTEEHYIFRFLQNTKIMVCYGCGKKFRKTVKDLPMAPNDLVLAKKEYRKYFDNVGQLKLSLKREFVHYHIKSSCVQAIDEEFTPQNIMITYNIRNGLADCHREVIARNLGIHV